jgi:hypothetical protein
LNADNRHRSTQSCFVAGPGHGDCVLVTPPDDVQVLRYRADLAAVRGFTAAAARQAGLEVPHRSRTGDPIGFSWKGTRTSAGKREKIHS